VTVVMALGLVLAAGVGCPRNVSGTSGLGTGEDVGADELQTEYADIELLTLLGELGHNPSILEAGVLVFELQGARIALFNQFGGDLQLYYGVTGGSWTMEQVNDWNKRQRFSRAYVDDEGDLVMEADLRAYDGISRRKIAVWLGLFERSLQAFMWEVAQ